MVTAVTCTLCFPSLTELIIIGNQWEPGEPGVPGEPGEPLAIANLTSRDTSPIVVFAVAGGSWKPDHSRVWAGLVIIMQPIISQDSEMMKSKKMENCQIKMILEHNKTHLHTSI